MTGTLEQPTQVKVHNRSVSQLNDWLHCSWSFYLKRIKRVPERPSVWLAGGKAFHTATEAFDRASWQDSDLSQFDPHDFEDAFEQAFDLHLAEMAEEFPDTPLDQYRTAGRKTRDKPNGEDINWWRIAGPVFVRDYLKWRQSTVDTLRIAPVVGAPGIEVEVDMPLAGIPMKGYVDRLMVDASTGELLVVDIKSGSRTPESPMQLATYAVQLERLVGQRPTWGAYYDARKGVLHPPIDLSAFTPERLGVVFRSLDRSVQQRTFLPRIDSHCKACGVKEACIWRGGQEPA
jgi:RecB family exonuclease